MENTQQAQTAPEATAAAPAETTFRVVGTHAAGSTSAAAPAPTPAPAPAPAAAAPEAATPAAPATTPATAEAPAKPVSIYEQYGLEDNDFTKKVLAAAKSPEEFRKLTQAYSTDYDTMDSKDLLRLEIRKNYPTLTDALVETKLNLRLRGEFNQGEEFEEDLRELGKVELDTLADRIREEYKQTQSAFQPTAPVAPDPEAIRQSTEAVLSSDPFMAQFETNGTITIGEGEDALNYAVANPKQVREYAHNTEELINAIAFDMVDGQKKFNGARFAKMVAFAQNPEAYEKALKDHYTSQAESREFNKGYVPPTPTGSGAPAPATPFKVIGVHPGRGR